MSRRSSQNSNPTSEEVITQEVEEIQESVETPKNEESVVVESEVAEPAQVLPSAMEDNTVIAEIPNAEAESVVTLLDCESGGEPQSNQEVPENNESNLNTISEMEKVKQEVEVPEVEVPVNSEKIVGVPKKSSLYKKLSGAVSRRH
jgi:hypothetical protein